MARRCAATAIPTSELECLLQQWGRQYGGSRYENVGFPTQNVLVRVIQHKGHIPDSQIARRVVKLDSTADQVEAAVLRMHAEGVDGEADAHILRVTYDPATVDVNARMRRLHAVGRRVGNLILANIKRTSMYARMDRAKTRLAVILTAD